jgi:hypothetical protein
MDAETKPALEAMEHRILQRIETVETRLLSAFHGWKPQIPPSFSPRSAAADGSE